MNAMATVSGIITAPNSLDRMMPVTFFKSYAADEKSAEHYTARALATRIRTVTAPAKAKLPWLKLARFGDLRTEKCSFRHDANVLSISGIEADYDGGTMHFEQAMERLEKQGIAAILYTSPSHTEDAPRWRVLCPLSTEMPPERRAPLLGRLNGLFGGIFSGESWTLSQSYYYGSINHNPSHRVELIDGLPLDAHDDLDAGWIGKPNTTAKTTPNGERASGPIDEPTLLAEITSGASYHQASVRLLGRWARNGVPYMEARARVIAAFEVVFPPDRDARWKMRRDDVDRCLEDIYGKEAAQKDHRKRESGGEGESRSAAGDAAGWPEPLDFLADAELTGAPELRHEHLPEAIAPFVFDAAARMGVDPSAIALAALVSLASVIDDDWCIQPKANDDTWTENPRLWGAIVGEPSMLKSPIIRVATATIDRMEAEARDRHEHAMRRYRSEMKAWKEAGSEPESEPKHPRLDRYMVEGTTTEALTEALRDDYQATQRAPAKKVLIRQDEMSEWVASFDRYRSGGRGGADRGAYLRLHNGGRHTIDRVNRGAFAIPNWSACILGGIQPGPVRAIAKDAADDGLLQRFCYCVPTRQTRGEDRRPDAAGLARYAALFTHLAAMHPSDSFGAGVRPVVLHAEAHQHRLAVLDLTEALASMPDASDRLKSALGKWPGLWARMTLVFHLIALADAKAQGDDTGTLVANVAKGAATTATSYMRDILLPHLLRAEAVMFATAQTGHARWIAGFILSKGGDRVAARDIMRAYGALRAPEHRRELTEVMAALEVCGWVRAEDQRDGRPASAWYVNPKLHSVFAERAGQERVRRQAARDQIRTTLAAFRAGETG